MQDYLGYALDWQNEDKAPVPALRLLATAAQWDLYDGLHPTLTDPNPDFFQRNPTDDSQQKGVSLDLQQRPMGCVHGHNTMADTGFTEMVDVDVNVPISPLFGRDLAGRIIYLGYGSEEKTLEHWASYNAHQQTPEGGFPNSGVVNITFPEGCAQVDENWQGAEVIENVFFTKFRTLDVAFDYQGQRSGDADFMVPGVYPNANLYPYKLRLDTFYTDGYKLPQLEAVFAKPDANKRHAEEAAQNVLKAWAEKAVESDYTAFYETQGGDAWGNALFEKGATLIPTFEACNGFHDVGADFSLQAYRAGRAVVGLHVVVQTMPSDEPVGTILSVKKPGFVLPHKVMPAEVITSDGSGYATPHHQDMVPLTPNLQLPHQRTAAIWGNTWLPTQPSHFEAPAIWGWDVTQPQSDDAQALTGMQTGRFLQKEGPLWDPLHYYYSCTQQVLATFEKPLSENRWLAPVPAEMKARFHPIVPLEGFDVPSQDALQRRQAKNILPRSAISHISTPKRSTDVGYHPLPLPYEFELDPFWFPDLHPLNRALPEIPESLQNNLAPVVNISLPRDTYLQHLADAPDAPWLKDTALMQRPTGEPLVDFPYLQRYLNPEMTLEDATALSLGVHLQMPEENRLNQTPQQVWEGLDSYDDLQAISDELFDAVWDVREKGQKLLELRHAIYQQNPSLYYYAWWRCVPLSMMEETFMAWQQAQNLRKLQQRQENTDKNYAPSRVSRASFMTPEN